MHEIHKGGHHAFEFFKEHDVWPSNDTEQNKGGPRTPRMKFTKGGTTPSNASKRVMKLEENKDCSCSSSCLFSQTCKRRCGRSNKRFWSNIVRHLTVLIVKQTAAHRAVKASCV